MFNRLTLAMALWMGAVMAAHSGILYEETEWDGVGTSWVGTEYSETPWMGGALGTPTYQGAGGNPGGNLDVDADTTGDFGVYTDYINTQSANLTGSYAANANEYVTFDFYYDQAAFSSGTGLQLYFVGNSGTYWVYNIALGSTSTGWNTASPISFASQGAWTDIYGMGGTFDSAELGNVQEIGFRLTYLPNTAQNFRFDNFEHGFTETAIPEPETYAALAIAFISLGIVFRKKLNEMLPAIGKG